jgi:hypothetical protein
VDIGQATMCRFSRTNALPPKHERNREREREVQIDRQTDRDRGGYSASHNVPFFTDIHAASGYPSVYGAAVSVERGRDRDRQRHRGGEIKMSLVDCVRVRRRESRDRQRETISRLLSHNSLLSQIRSQVLVRADATGGDFPSQPDLRHRRRGP